MRKADTCLFEYATVYEYAGVTATATIAIPTVIAKCFFPVDFLECIDD
jgi:hypothetical protein